MLARLSTIWQPILDRLPPWSGPGEPEFFRDFLGVRTRVSFMPPPYAPFAGTVEGPPGAERAGFLDPAEWAGALTGVLQARERFRAIELGAGFGPILVGSAVAAARLGISDIRLVGVEGAESHVAMMRRHFSDNGLDPDAHRLLHAVVGTYDGTAQFTRLLDPSIDWGGEALYQGANGTAGRTPQRSLDFDEVVCLSLPTILADFDTADVVHFDIQGAEREVIEDSITVLDRKVRRLVIGTHGRDLEQRLLEFLDGRGWILEIDKACSFHQPPPHAITLAQDGVQVWRNPVLTE
jgi:FkbM family methyltransferase